MTIGAVNPSLLNLLGYQEHDLIGESPGLIFGEEFAQGAIIENLLLQGSVSGVESSFLTHEGRKIPISVSGSMMQDQQGQFQGLVCVAQDSTERKRMEEEKLQLHEQLLDTSRQLGMAEVATGVLHNVGNVLNSLNVSIGVITDLLKNSMVGDVGRISQLLQKHREDLGAYFSQNPKGKQVPGYLEKLSRQLVEEKRVALLELDRLRENAGHAQQCVAAHQDLANPSGITEPVSLGELIDEALTVNQDVLEMFSINVIQEFQEVPQVIVDKHQVLQILVDVIRNACQAMESVSIKQLIVRVKLIIGPPDSICLEVQDTGNGIPRDDLTRIFGQGYSTKYGGRGLSLHRGALMAKNMGGALRAQSEGAGQGATFFLDLPGNFHFPDL
jgi:PAS domain S-box-containing protein